MFTNFLKKVADRDYLIFSECFFDFTSEGEQNCKIKILNYDLNGNIQKEEDMDKITNDFNFLLYGGYMLSWLAQILENETGVNRNDPTFWKKWGPILNPLFTAELRRDSSGGISQDLKEYNLSDILSLFNQKTKLAVIEKHAAVQFKIHKVYKNLLVRVVNIPLNQEVESQIYLFVILFNFFCKKYVNAHRILGFSCDVLMNHSLNRPFPIIVNKMMEIMLENPGNTSTIDMKNFSSRVSDKIFS